MGAVRVRLGKKREALDELQTLLGLDVKLYPTAEPVSLFYDVGVENGRIAVDCFGCFADPLVFFFHGGGQTRHSWKATAERLSVEGFCCITVDMKGHGDSYWHPHDKNNAITEAEYGYSYHDFAKDMDALVEQVTCGSDFRKVILVGASLGGLALMMSKTKLKARGVIFVDIAAKVDPKGSQRVIDFMSTHMEEGFASLEEALKVIGEYNPRSKNKVSLETSAGEEDASEKNSSVMKNLRLRNGRYFWHWDPKFVYNTKVSEDSLVFLEKQLNEQLELLDKTAVEPFLIRGKMTDVVSKEGVLAMKKVLKKLKFVDIEKAGHMVAGDQNDVFAEKVIEYCNSHKFLSPEVCVEMLQISLEQKTSKL